MGNVQGSTNSCSTCYLSCAFFTIISFILNISIYQYFSFWRACFCIETKSCIKLIRTWFNWYNVFINHKNKINYPNQYEYYLLAKFSSFEKNSKHHKPKTINFLNYNKYKDIKNWSNLLLLLLLLLHSLIWIFENFQLEFM